MINGNKSIIWWILALVFLIVLGTAVFWGYGYFKNVQEKNKVNQENNNLTEALSGINTLDSEKIPDAISKLKDILKAPTSLESEAYTKLLLAISYSQIEDFSTAAATLKEIYGNKNYSARMRELATDQLTNMANSKGEDFSKQYVFNDEPFKSFYKDKNFGIAIRKMAELSDSILPTIIPNYRIADWYSSELIKSKFYPSLSNSKRDSYEKIFKERIEKGDSSLALLPADQANNPDKDILVMAYTLKARLSYKSYILYGEDAEKIKAEDYFNQAKAVYEAVYLPKNMWFDVPLQYSMFLADTYGKTKDGIIDSLLSPIYDSTLRQKNAEFYNSLISQKNLTQKQSFFKRGILQLAAVDSRFKNLLKDLGWTDADFKEAIKPLK